MNSSNPTPADSARLPVPTREEAQREHREARLDAQKTLGDAGGSGAFPLLNGPEE